MDWDDSDPMTLNDSAMREAVPPTLPAGQKKFSINDDTEFQSPTNNSNATLGFAGRKISQGRMSSNSRGGDVLISGARADMVDSDIEEVESIHLAQQRQDSEIFRLYGSLPGFTDQQKRNAFSNTEERLEVNHIYLGIYRFDSSNNSNSSARKLYLRVDGGNNQFILLGLNNDADTVDRKSVV